MQARKAAQLRTNWGDKPCPHESLAKEYDQGQRTGSYVCKSCGRLFTFKEKAELTASREMKKPHVAEAEDQGDGQP